MLRRELSDQHAGNTSRRTQSVRFRSSDDVASVTVSRTGPQRSSKELEAFVEAADDNGANYTSAFLALATGFLEAGLTAGSAFQVIRVAHLAYFRRFESFESFELHISRFSRESIISQQRRRENAPDYLALTCL